MMMVKKATRSKSLAKEQAKFARAFLDTLDSVEARKEAAARIAGTDDTKARAYKSAMRRLQRYTTTTGQQKRDLFKSPKVADVIEDMIEDDPDLLEALVVEVQATIKYSEDKRRRAVRFELEADETIEFLSARNMAQAAKAISNIDRFANFQFSQVEYVEVIE